MKRGLGIRILVVVIAVGAAVAAKYLYGAVSYWKTSDVYKQYCNAEGVCATYIKDYRVNDTLTIGVTLLEATDSAGWEYLSNEFDILPEMVEAAEEDPTMDIWTRKTLKDHPETPYKESDANHQKGEARPVFEIVSLSMRKQEICIFHTQNDEEYDAILNNRINVNL